MSDGRREPRTEADRWSPLIPALGLLVGAGLALLLAALLATDGTWTALAIAGGGALGLVVGAAVRALRRSG